MSDEVIAGQGHSSFLFTEYPYSLYSAVAVELPLVFLEEARVFVF